MSLMYKVIIKSTKKKKKKLVNFLTDFEFRILTINNFCCRKQDEFVAHKAMELVLPMFSEYSVFKI